MHMYHDEDNRVDPAILRYCQYQERCHSEVRNKLYQLGMRTPDVEEQLSLLIAAGHLNEERFAIAWAGGKWRMLQWGRTKIRHGLRQKGVSDYCIGKAMREIPVEDYEAVLFQLIGKKATEMRSERSIFTKKAKILRFLLQRGFERDIVYDGIERYFRDQK